jgi:hypothetical protein
MKWLAECSAAAVREALRAVAPELSGYPFTVPEPDRVAQADPQYWKSSTVLDGRFIVKFAWSRPAAIRLAHEIGTLTALTREPSVPFLPEVVARSEAGIPLPDHRTPAAWVNDLLGRFTGLGIDPLTGKRRSDHDIS